MKYLSLLFICFIFTKVSCQNTLYGAKPTVQTKAALNYLFSDVTDTFDNLYVFHLTPNRCPRCEGLINPLIYEIRKQDTLKKIFIMVYDGDDVKSILKYQQLKNFKVDKIIIDKSSKLLNSIKYIKQTLAVPYFYKIKSKEMVYSSPLLGINVDSLLASKIVSSENKIPLVFKSQVELSNKQSSNGDIVFPVTFNINNMKDTLSNPKYCSFNPVSRKLIWLDGIFTRIALIDTIGNTIYNYGTSRSEFTNFIDINTPKNIIDYLIGNNIVNVLYLDLINIADSAFDVVASLPKVETIVKGEDTTVDYYNEIAIVTKSIYDNKSAINSLGIPLVLSDSGYFTKHSDMLKISNDEFILPLFKGWPVAGTANFDSTNKDYSYNTFLDGFYNNTPLFVKINKQTKEHKIYGSLDDFCNKTKTGYYFYKPVYSLYGNKIFFNNGVSNLLEIIDVKTLQKEQSVNLNFKSISSMLTKGKYIYSAQTKNIEYFTSLEQKGKQLVSQMVNKSDSEICYTLYDLTRKQVWIVNFNLSTKQSKKQLVLRNYDVINNFYTNLYKINDKVYLLLYTNIHSEKIIRVKEL